MSAPSSALIRHHRARIAALSRDRAPDDPDLVAARRQLALANLTDHVRKVTDGWPELTGDVGVLLRTGGVV